MDVQTGASATIARFEQRLALTQDALRTFGVALRTAIDALDERSREALVVTADVKEPGGDEPSHALAIVLHVYGYTATVAADGAERVSATSSLKALGERFAAIDGVFVRDGISKLHATDRDIDAPTFLDTVIAAVAADVDRRAASYNPALA